MIHHEYNIIINTWCARARGKAASPSGERGNVRTTLAERSRRIRKRALASGSNDGTRCRCGQPRRSPFRVSGPTIRFSYACPTVAEIGSVMLAQPERRDVRLCLPNWDGICSVMLAQPATAIRFSYACTTGAETSGRARSRGLPWRSENFFTLPLAFRRPI